MTKEELAKEEMIGKYVDYKSAGTNYTVEAQYSGTDADQIFETNADMKWRIWGVQDNKLLLISETVAGNITFKNAEGYNNGVKILNDACSTAFGNTTKYREGAITARSINQEDIDKVTNMTTDAQRKAIQSWYGKVYSKSVYPVIYAQESGKTGGGSLGRSEQTNWYTGVSKSSFTGKSTGYQYYINKVGTKTIYDSLITNPTPNSQVGSTNSGAYWIATRDTANVSDVQLCFTLGYVGNGCKSFVVLLDTYYPDIDRERSGALRPMVQIDLDLAKIGSQMLEGTEKLLVLPR